MREVRCERARADMAATSAQRRDRTPHQHDRGLAARRDPPSVVALVAGRMADALAGAQHALFLDMGGNVRREKGR